MFIRQDLPVEHQLVQSSHAVFQLASLYAGGEATPNMVLIGVPDPRALARVAAKLKQNQIPHYEWREPDWQEYGFADPLTAIATAPLNAAEKQVLQHYRLYRHAGGNAQALCAGNRDARTIPPEPAQAGLRPCG